jgi:Na+/H+ antiporter NhaA
VAEASESQFVRGTAWTRNLETPLREFLRTETGSAAILLAATVAALLWVNLDASSYDALWHTTFALRLGSAGIVQDLRHWVNDGLMTFFFFVVGLEARREFDLGELRERRRAALPIVAGLAGMATAILLYLAINGGGAGAHGWGVAMSTDTAFALGLLVLLGPRFPDRLRAFMLTVVVVDDLVALVVIATVYTTSLALVPLLTGVGLLAVVFALRSFGRWLGVVYAALGLAAWVAFFESGVDPVVVGLVLGLLVYAYPAARPDLERASERFRLFREQPTPELARAARTGVESAISPNERLAQRFHPWTSYLIVPLFALANAGIAVGGGFLSRAFTSPITLGIIVGYVAGKPVGVVGASWLVSRLSRGRLRPPVGWAAVIGGGAVAGISFTVSLLVASLAFRGTRLEEAKLGVLSAAALAAVSTWTVFRVTDLLPKRFRLRALLGSSEPIVDLAVAVDDEHDHIRGPLDAPVTVVEYADFECPYCGRAEPVIRELLADTGDVRYVWRHLPLNDVHPSAQLAAEATEAAAAQGAFWEMHDRLLAHQDTLRVPDLLGFARELGLDEERFADDLRRHAGAAHVARDVDSADLSGVTGTPTFFINGRRHHGVYDITALEAAAHAARARALLAGGREQTAAA